MEERIKELNQDIFFKEKIGLAEAIAKIEAKTRIKIPNSFTRIDMGEYQFGTLQIKLGKIANYYLFSVSEDGIAWKYEAFDSKQSFLLFFAEDGMPSDVAAFFRNEILDIPNFM
jgi:hypothetical protein